jgi:hypothetical protein
LLPVPARWLVVALVATISSTAGAQEPPGIDYDVDNKGWNGISDLVGLAGSAGVELEARAELDWTDLGPGDVLFVMYPTRTLDPVHVAAFLRQGGRVLLADDFGKSDEALARLNVLRHPARTARAGLHNKNPQLPIATPLDKDHPLAEGVRELITNHPSVFSVSPGPDVVLGFSEDEAIVVAGQLGEGRFVALSDPSTLINGMLVFEGNLRFAMNIISFLALPGDDGRPTRIVVVTQDASFRGEPRGALDEAAESSSLNDLLGDVGKFLDELNDYLAPADVLRSLSWSLAALAVLVGAVFIPLRRAREADGSFARPAQGGDERVGAERLLADFEEGRTRNFSFPASVLRETLEAQIADLIGELEPFTTLEPTRVAQRLVDGRATSTEGALAVARAMRRLRKVPTRAQLVVQPTAFISQRDFDDIRQSVAEARRALQRA